MMISIPFSKLEEDIVELDRLNMASYFAAENRLFDPAIRFDGLRREFADGAKILQVRRHAKLVAYLEYIPPLDGKFYVPSLQIHPDYLGSSVLRSILIQAAECINSWPAATLRTRVHDQNLKSVRLHQKLGFHRIPSDDKRLHFEISSEVLKDSLKVFYCNRRYRSSQEIE
jgi:hypothetical protein